MVSAHVLTLPSETETAFHERETGRLALCPQAMPALAEQSPCRRILSVTYRSTGWWWTITQQDLFLRAVDVPPQEALMEFLQAYRDVEREPTCWNLGELFLWLDELPTGYFDQVHLVSGAYAIPTRDLPRLLHELARVCRCGGVVRWTEGAPPETSSPAFEQLIILLLQALQKAESGALPQGATPEARERNMLAFMARILREIGCLDMRHFPLVLDVSASAALHPLFVQQICPLLAPLRSHTLLVEQREPSEVIEMLYHQRWEEAMHHLFQGTCTLHTLEGTKAQQTAIFSTVLALAASAMA